MSFQRSGIPGPVLAIAILNGIVGAAVSLLVLLMLVAVPGPLIAMFADAEASGDVQMKSAMAEARMAFSMFVPFAVAMAIAGLAAVIGAIGLMRLRNWGRLMTLCIAWLHIMFAIVILITYFVVPTGGPRSKPWDGVLSLAYSILVLSVLMSAPVRAAFQHAQASQQSRISSIPAAASL